MKPKQLQISAGPHSRTNCPVTVKLDDHTAGLGCLRDQENGENIPCQLSACPSSGRTMLSFVLPKLGAGETKVYDCVPDAAASPLAVRLAEGDGKVDVSVGGSLFTSYVYSGKYVRPFLHPIVGPHGDPVTRAYPVIPDVPGEKQDHPHHKSVWTAWGDVNGVDNWSEGPEHGWMVHQRLTTLEDGAACGKITAVNDWLDKKKAVKQLEEERTIRFHATPAAGRLVDFCIRLRLTEGDVRFGDTKEGGILSVRVATSMDAADAGTIRNSYGGTNEAETWGKRAHWCDYYGPVNGKTVGITIFDHPDNFRFPTYWHVRNYGLMTANPFGLSHFEQGKGIDGSHTFPAGSEVVFRYRLYIHAGNTEAADVAGKYHDYINPPKVEVL